MDREAPILFFDSGVGGLSVLGPTRKLLPDAAMVYAADNAWFPYGKRSEAALAERVSSVLARLAGLYSPRLIVIACNTASTIALDHARAGLDLPIVGTVPAIKPAAEMSKSRVIGVLGTEATVRQPYVDELAARFASDCTIVRHGSPELVELAEAKLRGERVAAGSVEMAIRPMVDAAPAMDVVVLACTHFPLLANEIAAASPNIAQVDGAAGIARRIAYLTRDQGWAAQPAPGIAVFTTPPPPSLLPALGRFGLSEVKTLDIPIG